MIFSGGGDSNPKSTKTTSSTKPANTGGSSSGGNGKTYSASFTQYGSTDSWGSGNCQTKSTACGFYTQGYNAAISQNEFGVGPVRYPYPKSTANTLLTYPHRALVPVPAAARVGSLRSTPTALAAKSATRATASLSWSQTCARPKEIRYARSLGSRERISTARTSTSIFALTPRRTPRCSETVALAWAWVMRCRWTALSGVVASCGREFGLWRWRVCVFV